MNLKNKIIKWRKDRHLRKIAKAFNEYKIDKLIDPKWMRDKCGLVHSPVENSPFVGYIYPACCSYPRRHRWYF